MTAPGSDVTGPINIGNPGEFTIHALAEMVIDLTESRSRIVYLPVHRTTPCRTALTYPALAKSCAGGRRCR